MINIHLPTVISNLGGKLSPRRILLLILFIIIIGYAAYQASDIVRGPAIDLSSPNDGLTEEDGLTVLTGLARRLAYLSLDDNQIFTNSAGQFKEKLLLAPGYNIIKLRAEDRFNRRVEKTLQIIRP